MEGFAIIILVLVLAAAIPEAEPRPINPSLDSLMRSLRDPEGEVRTRRFFDSHADDAFGDRDGLKNGDTKH